MNPQLRRTGSAVVAKNSREPLGYDSAALEIMARTVLSSEFSQTPMGNGVIVVVVRLLAFCWR